MTLLDLCIGIAVPMIVFFTVSLPAIKTWNLYKTKQREYWAQKEAEV